MSKVKQTIKKILGYKNLTYIHFVKNTYRKSKKHNNNENLLNVLLKSK